MANTKSSSGKEQVKPHFSYVRFFLSLLLILAGASLVFLSTYENFGFNFNVKASGASEVKQVSVKPLKIYIPKLGRVLYISDGAVIDNRWVTSPTNVSYLTSSATPGSKGNTVMYGHNTISVLGGLWRVQDGDPIYVVMNNGQFYKYQVFERREVAPTEVSILSPSEDSRLTLYTCSGFLDSARFVVTSKLQTI